MKTHAQRGYDLLKQAGDFMGKRGDFLTFAMEIARYHHEKWDGTGYPLGLKGEEIPISARMFAVVDVFDALINDRPYRRAMREEDVISYLREQSGRHFDPRIVDTFLQVVKGTPTE